MMFSERTLKLAEITVDWLKSRKLRIVTAESCTGGLIAGALTAIPGSSEVVYGGFVTYANEAKQRMINIPGPLIEEYGAVSEQVARAMAAGALETSGADMCISVSGIAGPGGGSVEKPVGLVHFGWAMKGKVHGVEMGGKTHHMKKEFGDIGRDNVRMETLNCALDMVLEMLDGM